MAHYPELIYWKSNYANPGVLDQRAIQAYVDCETRERINSLRTQLHSISKGRYDDALFQKLFGPDRKQRHGSYQEWAKLMLRWLAEYSSQS
jgi:hypothetical protein